MGPCTSHRADWATPTPGMPMAVEASRHTHSPTAGRCMYTVRSGLMKTWWTKSSSGAHPVAEVRCRHHPLQRRRRLAGHDGHGQADPHRGRAGPVEGPRHVLQLGSGVVEGPVGGDGRGRAVALPGARRRARVDAGDWTGTGELGPGRVGGSVGGGAVSGGVVGAGVGRLQADAQRPPPRHVPVTARDAGVDELDLAARARRSTPTPTSGRGVRAADSSTVSRATCMGSSVGTDSTARASNAATGPPCSASGVHGPRASSVGTTSVTFGVEERVRVGLGHGAGGSSRSSTHAGGRAVKPSSGHSIHPDMPPVPRRPGAASCP